MFRLTEPSSQAVLELIADQRRKPFSYSDVGATNSTPPRDFTIDHNRIQLGKGVETFRKAVAALKKWRQFDLGWVTLVPEDVPIEVGATVAVKARAFGTWSLNVTRIVYVINEERRFGFAYGTLPHHVECGEERFLIEWDADDSVSYDILAFSQPRHPLVRLGKPFTRMLQKRFARDSMKRMAREISSTKANLQSG
jgi:uncharacterized protein (UPF0548 family)